MKLIPVALLLLSAVLPLQAEEQRTIRICDDSGCSDRPRNTTTFNPNADANPEAERRLTALKAKAEAVRGNEAGDRKGGFRFAVLWADAVIARDCG